jgi:hypothetical protein
MKGIRFTWDETKAQTNLLKHKISFNKAASVFSDYFKKLSKEVGIPYQNLINSYLAECAQQHKKPELKWA